jgi:2-iminobutanoate/2-iminopropanoate deaminase
MQAYSATLEETMTITKHEIGVSQHIGNYSDVAVASPNAPWLHTSGTPGIDSSGNAPEGIVAQAELVWQNIFAALKAGGMRPEDLVKTTSYVTRREDVAEYVKIRAKYLGDIRPAQLLLLVDGHIKPEYLVEVDAIAAAE